MNINERIVGVIYKLISWYNRFGSIGKGNIMKKAIIGLLAGLLLMPDVIVSASSVSNSIKQSRSDASTVTSQISSCSQSSTTKETTSDSTATSSSQSKNKDNLSDLQKLDKIVQVVRKTMLYNDESMTSFVSIEANKSYHVLGQRYINDKLYYYVESDEQKGYLLAQDVQEVKKVDLSQTLTCIEDGNYYSDFNGNIAGNIEKGCQYYTDGYYIIDGICYYSIFSEDASGSRSWLGYAKESNVQLLQSEKLSKQVTVKKSGSRWQNFFWRKKGDLQIGHVYQVKRRYRLGSGRNYYSLYRTDKNGKEVWCGYANTSLFNDLKKIKKETKITATKEYKRYQDFFFNTKGEIKKGQVYNSNGYYELGNGNRYYSLYQTDAKGKRVWKGYANINSFRQLKLKKQTKLVTVKKEYKRYQDFFWNKKGNATQGQVYESHGYYELGNGMKYYTLYKKDKNGQSKWYGYTNTKAFKDFKATKINKRAKVVNNYKRYRDFFWNKKGDLKGYQKKTVVVKYRYTIGNGTQYYSIYSTNDKWLGYVNAKAVKIYRYKKLNVPNYNQYTYQVPTGCEGTALLQALQYKGYVKKENPTTFLKKIPRTNSPYTGFGGNPFLPDVQPGFPAIFSKPLAKWGKKYGNVIDYSGKSFSTAINEVMKGNPSVIYVTVGLKPVQWGSFAFGKAVINNHAVTLAGYDEEKGKVYLSDSISGKYWASYSKVKKIYDARKWTVTVRSK